MSFNKDDGGIQYSRKKMIEFAIADVIAAGSAVFLGLIDIPPGCIVTGGALNILTAFNSTATDTIAVGDATTTNRYLGATSVHTTGYTALVPTGAPVTTTAMQTVGIVWTSGGGTPTTGFGYLTVDYVRPGAADEYYTLSDPIAP
ncbi:MAG: hypothetical protein ABSG90_13780 [Dehalococcoidia bacterium]|jgi:hypothetical protein